MSIAGGTIHNSQAVETDQIALQLMNGLRERCTLFSHKEE
jgi:hypothetical protein